MPSIKSIKSIKSLLNFTEDKDFSKTIVPVRLAQYGSNHLVSRSQAKRVVANLEAFSTVALDFAGVDSIGQGFADEIFRVFRRSHPNIKLMAIHCSAAVQSMIDHVEKAKRIASGQV